MKMTSKRILKKIKPPEFSKTGQRFGQNEQFEIQEPKIKAAKASSQIHQKYIKFSRQVKNLN